MVDSSFSIRQEMFNGTHYGKKMARLAIAGFSANVGNVRYTDHSIEQTPSAGMAEQETASLGPSASTPGRKPDSHKQNRPTNLVGLFQCFLLLHFLN